ncbi:MAG: sensor histidine kinase [Kineosporiaceae bacterium]|nr:sensor histidine kinase [Kineosporiaceae bacterium]
MSVDLMRGGRLVALTVALAVVFAASALQQGELTGVAACALVLLNTAPVLLVARNPVVVVLAFSVTYQLWLDPPGSDLVREGHVLQSMPTLVALYAAGAWNRLLWVRGLALATPAWMLGAAVTGYWPTSVDDLIYVALVFVIVWWLGVVDAGRRSYASQLEVRTRELEQARHALADQAVARERARLARELHDVVAHAMSVITVQAGVGGHLIASRPERAAEALGVIEGTGREALAELRRMLLVLRPRDHAAAAPPQPGVADLPLLLDNARATGLRVSMHQKGSPAPLSPGLDLAVYRVMQESLTNASKHAPGSRVDVHLRWQSHTVEVEVADHGPGAPDGVRRGQGLSGMAERVTLYDGVLEAGNGSAGNGFRVRATFPLQHDRVVG